MIDPELDREKRATLSTVDYAKWRYAETQDRNGYYDTLTAGIMHEVLKQDSVSIDVGCHAGTILDIMLDIAPKGRVLAFEPIPQLFELLVGKYGNDPRVELSRFALSDERGASEFHWVTSNPGYSGFRERHYDRPNEQIEIIKVETVPLDELIGPDQKIDLIKIDVEGAELHVLKGAIELLKRDRPVVIFEHGLGAADYYGIQPDDIHALLCGECGLNISMLSDFLEKKPAMTLEQFRNQYFVDWDYYFVAH